MITKIPLALKCSDCPVCQLTLPLHWLTGRTRDALCAAPSPTAVGAPLSAARSCSHLQSPSCAFLRLSPYLITQFFPHHLRLLCPQLTSLTICTLITSSGWLFLVPHFPPCGPELLAAVWASLLHHLDEGRDTTVQTATVLQGL